MRENPEPGRRRRVVKDFERLSVVCEVNPFGTDTPTTSSAHCIFFIGEQPIDSYMLTLDLSKGRRSLEHPFHGKLYIYPLDEWFHAKGSLMLRRDEEDNLALMLDMAFWYGSDFDEPVQRVEDCIVISAGNPADGQADDTKEGADDAN
jgi:hypothetical protein